MKLVPKFAVGDFVQWIDKGQNKTGEVTHVFIKGQRCKVLGTGRERGQVIDASCLAKVERANGATEGAASKKLESVAESKARRKKANDLNQTSKAGEQAAGPEAPAPNPASGGGGIAHHAQGGEVTALATQQAGVVTTDMVRQDMGGFLAIRAEDALAQVQEIEKFCAQVLKKGIDYGIPDCTTCGGTGKTKDGRGECGTCKGTGENAGIKKPFLLKPGAVWFLKIHGTYARVEVDWDHSIENWGELDMTTGEYPVEAYPMFSYHVTAMVHSKLTGAVAGNGIGHCNSREDRYLWRQSKRRCPECEMPTIFPSKFPPAKWYCNLKAGGCNSKFMDGDERIESQVVGRSLNQDIATLPNTILEMASKRAISHACHNTTAASRYYTQDPDAMPAMGEKMRPGAAYLGDDVQDAQLVPVHGDDDSKGDDAGTDGPRQSVVDGGRGEDGPHPPTVPEDRPPAAAPPQTARPPVGPASPQNMPERMSPGEVSPEPDEERTGPPKGAPAAATAPAVRDETYAPTREQFKVLKTQCMEWQLEIDTGPPVKVAFPNPVHAALGAPVPQSPEAQFLELRTLNHRHVDIIIKTLANKELIEARLDDLQAEDVPF